MQVKVQVLGFTRASLPDLPARDLVPSLESRPLRVGLTFGLTNVRVSRIRMNWGLVILHCR